MTAVEKIIKMQQRAIKRKQSDKELDTINNICQWLFVNDMLDKVSDVYCYRGTGYVKGSEFGEFVIFNGFPFGFDEAPCYDSESGAKHYIRTIVNREYSEKTQGEDFRKII